MNEIYLINETPGESFELFIGCIGFEKRSCFYLEEYTNKFKCDLIMFDYKANGLFSYESNLQTSIKLGAEIHCDFPLLLNSIRNRLHIEINLIVDITSFDRKKLAQLLALFFENKERINLIKLVYAPRKFREIELKFDVVQSFGPVTEKFFGSSSIHRQSLTLILGAGYEFGKAVGAIDTLEPSDVYCFRPTGTDVRFDQYIEKANVNFSFMENPNNTYIYNLNNAAELYFELRRLVHIAINTSNVMILPLGPKLFAALSMIIGLIYHPTVMVWRHSTS